MVSLAFAPWWSGTPPTVLVLVLSVMDDFSDTQFQSFVDRSDRAAIALRIISLREQLEAHGVQGFIVPRADRHQGEYVPTCDERLAWLTGFGGSAGCAIVLMDKAALVVDGRYTLQVADQTDTTVITPVAQATTSIEAWISDNLPAGSVLAYDPWLHTSVQVDKLEKAAAKAGGSLKALDANPVDIIWTDRPAAPSAPVEVHPIALAGEAVKDKLARIRAALVKDGLTALVITDPHNIAWAFNVRGQDVAHTPVPLCDAIIFADGPARIFIAPEKVSSDVQTAFKGLADIASPDSLMTAISALGRSAAKVRLDKTTAASAIANHLRDAGGHVDQGDDPITLMKAVKNKAEVSGSRAAHIRDGVALVRFLAWLTQQAPSGDLSEIDAVLMLEACRMASGELREISFDTIAGSGPNGAIVHYRVTEATNRNMQPGELFLIDSGGQYRDGTTDVTRTIAVGTPTPEMRDRFTRVLKGHIAIARAVFPKHSTGAQIDSFARLPLWQAGLDFEHGTGHGVGSYLSVHEGPQRISRLGHVALQPGMILSNEPGYYKAGAYGIRIENLILVEPRTIAGAEKDMLGFETLTLAPIDRILVDISLLSADEITWLNDYHARVRDTLMPLMTEAETRNWLTAACAPL
jgi:Xaa-Pro aminopeptidase